MLIPKSDMTHEDSLKQLYKYASENCHVQESIDIIEECLRRCSLSGDKFCVSFNGGKDCTVLLHLLYSVLMSKRRVSRDENEINALYIKIPDMFPEMDEFVQKSVERYHLALLEFDGPDIKKALQRLQSLDVGQKLEYILMGTRATDLAYSLDTFQKTDSGWPQFTRVNPLLNWSYAQIWSFLKDLDVAYCSLYDKGYTSLGSRSNTVLNPKLRSVTPEGQVIYLPAYLLSDPGDERNGRL